MGCSVSSYADEVELIAASIRGQVDAFGQLVKRYQSLVCAVSFSATGDRALSEDVAQETFVAAWNGLADLQEPSKLRSWLCGIARNLSSKALRRIGREIPSDAEVQAALNEVAAGTSPLDDALTKESEQLVWTALHRVPETYREPLVLFYREDQSTQQVAETLGLSESAVQQRLSRGRQHLKASAADLVERTLERTKPSKGFAAGVVAVISTGASMGTAEATATQATSSVTSTAAGSPLAFAGGLLAMKLTTKLIILAVLVLLASGTTILIARLGQTDAGQGAGPSSGGSTAAAPTKRTDTAPTRASLPVVERDDEPRGSLRLEGQVIDLDDLPVAGALVFLATTPPTIARSEADGSFLFTGLIGRRYELWAHADELVSGRVVHQLSNQSDPVIVRLREGMVLEVAVVDARTERPVPGATVRWTSADELAATTDSDGRASLRGVMPGEHQLEVEAPGFAMQSARRTVPDQAGTVLTHRFTLHRGVAVSGRVVDEHGDAIAGVSVVAAAVDSSAPAAREVTTNARGLFALPVLAPGTYRCAATHRDYAPAVSPPFAVDEAPIDDRQLVMSAGGVVAGQVVSAAGDPVAHAEVHVAGRSNRQVFADETGWFRMTGLPRSQLQVLASSPVAASEIIRIDLRETGERTDLVLTLTVDGQIAGVVIDDSGEAVADAQVVAVPDLRGGAPLEQLTVRGGVWTTADAAGKFVVQGLPAGSYELRATRTQFGGNILWLPAVVAATGETAVELMLTETGGIIGRLQFADGSAPTLASVEVGNQAAVPVAGGHIELTGIPPQRHSLLIRGTDFPTKVLANVVVAAGELTDLGPVTLERGRAVSGQVVDEQGAPVAGADVVLAHQLASDGKNLLSPAGEREAARFAMGSRRAITDDDGRFRVGGLSGEELTIAAQFDTYGRSRPARIPAGAGDAVVDLALVRFGSLVGRVTANGKAQSGASVLISATSGAGKQSINVSTAPDGSFAIERIPAGDYEIRVRARSNSTRKEFSSTSLGRGHAVVEAGEETRVTIDIAVGEITLTVETQVEGTGRIDLTEGYLFAGIVEATTPVDFAGAGQAVKRNTALAGNPLVFDQVVAGRYTVCAMVISGNIYDRTFLEKLKKHAAELPVYCQPVEVQPSPAAQRTVVTVRPMPPMPNETDSRETD